MRRYFDPSVYRIVLFDQRGCGGRARMPRSSRTPPGIWCRTSSVFAPRWRSTSFILFGGSWGATLALIYALTHPDRVVHLALRGVFLMTRAELDWFYGGGAGAFFPDLWARFTHAIPADERET